MIFPMSLDRLNRVMTGVALALLTAAFLGIAVVAPAALGNPGVGIVIIVVGTSLAIAWAGAPVGVELTGGALRILRRARRPVELPLTTITGVDVRPTLRAGVRLWGVAGFFGSYGLFWSLGVGRFRAWVTRGRSGVLLHRQGALPVLVSPDDPERFAAAVAAAIGLAPPAPR